MSKGLRLLAKLNHYHSPVVGVVGLAATVALYGPGADTVGVGPVQVDAFYVAGVSFGALLVLSLLDGYYDPEDYGLEESDSDP